MQKLIIYKCIHQRLSKKFGENKFADRSEFFITISRLYHVQKKLMPIVFRELKQLNIIEESSDQFRKKVRVTPLEDNPEDLLYV